MATNPFKGKESKKEEKAEKKLPPFAYKGGEKKEAKKMVGKAKK